MLIRIYNYAKCKNAMTSAFIKDVLDKYYPNRYYLDNEWHNGPSTSIVIDGFNEFPHLQLTREWVKQYKETHPISKDNVIDINDPFEVLQRKISSLNQVAMEDDGHVEFVKRGESTDCTRSQLNSFDRFRFRLQPIYNDINKVVSTLTIKEKNQLFLDMFMEVANLYDGCIEYGYTSLRVKIDSFFSQSSAKDSKRNIEESFESSRVILFGSEKVTLSSHAEQLIVKWREEWLSIKLELTESFDRNELFDGATLLELEKQFLKVKNGLRKKSAYADCPKGESVQEFITSDQALIFSSLINLLYVSFPSIEKDSIKNHFYAYCTVRQIEDEYSNQFILHNTY